VTGLLGYDLLACRAGRVLTGFQGVSFVVFFENSKNSGNLEILRTFG
jgi:hypothetical protein